MRQSWGDFLKGAGTHSHGVQVYEDAGDLADSVAAYLAAGFERDQPAVVVSTPEHLSLFAERLATRGWEFADAESAGLLVVADAEETLAEIMGPNGVDHAQLDRSLVDVLARVQRGPDARPVRVFGEMVDLLCRRGDADAADELEQRFTLQACDSPGVSSSRAPARTRTACRSTRTPPISPTP